MVNSKKIKRKFSDFVLKNSTFPIEEAESGTEMMWMFKGCCPCCLSNPIEYLSNEEYNRKYPVEYNIEFGNTTIYLCGYHMKKLKEEFAEFEVKE